MNRSWEKVVNCCCWNQFFFFHFFKGGGGSSQVPFALEARSEFAVKGRMLSVQLTGSSKFRFTEQQFLLTKQEKTKKFRERLWQTQDQKETGPSRSDGHRTWELNEDVEHREAGQPLVNSLTEDALTKLKNWTSWVYKHILQCSVQTQDISPLGNCIRKLPALFSHLKTALLPI